MSLNPNFPQMEYGWGAVWNCNAGDSPLDRYVDVTPRTYGTVGTSRGRQYELDLVQAGTINAQLTSTDGALDPNNKTGPWAGNIWPYQPFRVRAQWPPTINLLDPVIANGGDGQPTGALNNGNNGQDVFTATDPNGTGNIVASASAYTGSNVFQMAVPASTAVGARICYTPQTAVTPGATYSLTMHVRNVTDATSLDVKPFIGWYGPPPPIPPSTYTYGTTTTLTGSSTATGWASITLTATAPANPYGMTFGVAVATVNSALCNVQVDGWQLEKSATPSAFVSPGTWYPMYSGFVERWPQSWALNSTLGLVQPTGVDAFALLSQRILRAPFTEEVYSRNPTFLFTLGDPQGVQSFTDSTGRYPPAQINSGKYGPGTLTSGNSITSASSTGSYTGSSGSVVTISNSNPGTPQPGPASFISLSNAGINGPQTPNTWTRIVAFRYTGPTPTDRSVIWSTLDRRRSGGLPSGSEIAFTIDSSGKFYILVNNASATGGSYYPQQGGVTFNVVDSNWHLAGISLNAATGDLYASLDGVTTYWSGQGGVNPTNCTSDALGNWVDDTIGNSTVWNYKGDISYAMEFPTALAPSDFTAIYSAWKNSFSGDSTDQRYARILTYAGYTGPSTVQTGLTRSMGPMNADGQDALSALGDVVITENGEHFVDRTGSVVFRSRSARYNSTTPVYVFGENVSAGEYPYEEVELDFDPTHLANLVEITQSSTNQVFTAADSTSQTNYFPRTMQRDVNSSSALECQDAAGYLMHRYKNPLPRVSLLKLHPAANTALWPVCLGMELGTRVRIMRRPLGAPAIQIDAFVEKIDWQVDDKGEAFLTLQCSPVDAQPYASFAVWRTTLNAGIASGITTITVNATSDTVNPLAAQVGYGQQLVLGLGTANQETVTVLSVGATSPGWTTGTITLQAATTKSHSANDTVCEPLPAGVTATSTYDTLATFDSVAFAY